VSAPGGAAPQKAAPQGSAPQARGRVEACRRFLRRRGGLAATLLGLGAAGMMLPLAWLLAGSAGWRPGSALPLVLALAGLALALGGAAWILVRTWKMADLDALVPSMERATGLPSGRLRAQLELEAEPPPGTSGALVAMGGRELASRLAAGEADLAGEAGGASARLLRLAAGVAGAAALVTLGLLLASPGRSVAAWSGVARPMAVLHPAPLAPLEVTPGDATVPRGDSLELEVLASGRRSVTLHLEQPGAVPRAVVLPTAGGRASGWSGPVTAPTRYRFEGDDGAVSPTFELRPRDPLLLASFRLEVVPPPWTGLPPEAHDYPPEELAVPAGSELRFSGVLMGEAQSLHLAGGESEDALVELTLDGAAFEGRWRPAASTLVRWRAQGNFPAGRRLPPDMALELIPDRAPEVALTGPPEGAELPGSGILPLRIEARDDWGLDRVELHVEVLAPGADPVRLVEGTDAGGRTRLELGPRVETAGWGAPPGTRIRVWAQATDRGAGPGQGRSETLEYRLAGPSAVVRDTREGVDRAADEVARLADQAEQAARDLEELRRENVASGAPTPGSDPGASAAPQGGDAAAEASARGSESLRQALAAEAELLARLDALRATLGQGNEALGGSGGAPDLQRLLDGLDRAFEAVAGPEGRDARDGALAEARDLLDAAAQGQEPLTAAALSELLAEAAERGEELAQRLDALEREMAEAAFQSGLAGLREETTALAQEQAAVAEAFQEGAPNEAELRARQEELADRLAAAQEALERVQDAAPADAPAAGAVKASLDQAGQAMAQARGDMETAAGAGAGEAGPAASAAADAAEEARRAVEAAEEAASEARRELFRETLSGVVSDALALSELAGRPEAAGPPAATRVNVLGSGARAMARNVAEAGPVLGDVARDLSLRLGQALAALEDASGAGQTSAQRAPFDTPRVAFDRVALAALAALARGPSDDGGPRPDEGQAMAEALQELAQQQEALNQDAGGDPQSAGGTPTPSSGGAPGELAERQEAVASGLGELASQPGGERMPGSLEALAREAEAVARELASLGQGERPTAETRDRQERLLDRMLEAGRTLERDGPTEERRGQAALQGFERPLVPSLPEGLLSASFIPLPDAAALQGLTPGERRLVLEYFQRLRREPNR
jgi:hypothetical protein